MTPSGKAKESSNWTDPGPLIATVDTHRSFTLRNIARVSKEHRVGDEEQRVFGDGARRIEGESQETEVSGKAGMKELQYRPRWLWKEGRKSVRTVVDTRFRTKRELSKESHVTSVFFLLRQTHWENVHSSGYFWRQRFEGAFNVSLYTFWSYRNILQQAWSPLVIKKNSLKF